MTNKWMIHHIIQNCTVTFTNMTNKWMIPHDIIQNCTVINMTNKWMTLGLISVGS